MATTDRPKDVPRPFALDRIDLEILRILRDDGRVSVPILGERTGISRANAYARLERLRADGVITGFSARVSARKTGNGLTAFIFLKVKSPARDALAGPIRAIAGIEYCAFVTGDHDVVIKARVPDVETLRDQIMVKLYEQAAVTATHTVFVLDEVVDRPYVLPD